MAKTRPKKAKNKQKKRVQEAFPPELIQVYLANAVNLLNQGDPQQALANAQNAAKCLQALDSPQAPLAPLSIYTVLGECHLELGDGDQARHAFLEAAKLDPDGSLPDEVGGGADKFLWLAQLSEQGGKESVEYYELACTALRARIASAEGKVLAEDEEQQLAQKKQKLATALCGIAEVYMTDLSWEEDAEERCERLVTEACLVGPDQPESLQTLASVRLSQSRFEDAKAALSRSLLLWDHLELGDARIPEFPTRISLARLLMEAHMEEEAMTVIDRLLAEDDSSVEAWYLGGWCQHLLAQSLPATDDRDSERKRHLLQCRRMLTLCLKQYAAVDYEDDRLRDHAQEIIDEINGLVGPPLEGEAEDESDWESGDASDGEDVHE